ncbi:unnamed protein product, partial [Alopecurus aequalis]
MPQSRRWADLPSDLLRRISDSLDLKCYANARGSCTTWRCTLAPPSPSLLLILDDGATCRMSVASLPARRSFELKAIPRRRRCFGSSNGWLALTLYVYHDQIMFILFNPITGTEIALPPLVYNSTRPSKLVFAPGPASDDFAAAAICDVDRLAYVIGGARRWAILGPVHLAAGDHFVDIVYHEKGRVYCLTHYGDVKVLSLPERCRQEPAMVDDPSSVPAIPPLASPAQRASLAIGRAQQEGDMRLRRSLGLDLNASAAVAEFDHAASFAPPYDTLSVFTSAKNLVFCEGNLYQIWRNASCTVTVRLPGGGHRRVVENEVFVLRYYPRRQPCWHAATDLGEYSVFVGRSNAVAMYAQGVPGLKGNCVYWIGGRGSDQGMAFDMETGRSTPCLPTAVGVAPQRIFGWY